MTHNPKIHRRRSLRLTEYDYTQVGAYFVTIVLQNRLCLFGEIIKTEMQLSEAGEMVHQAWEALPDRFPTITIDTFTVMPNHLHGIIMINQPTAEHTAKPTVGAALVAAQPVAAQPVAAEPVAAEPVAAQPALGDIIGAYKSLTTVEYTRGVKTMKWTPFPRRLWQRNYYEHIIRNDDALGRIRQYIVGNPGQWDFDRENPFVDKANLVSSRRQHPYEV